MLTRHTKTIICFVFTTKARDITSWAVITQYRVNLGMRQTCSCVAEEYLILEKIKF